jgi:hypothetical protein
VGIFSLIEEYKSLAFIEDSSKRGSKASLRGKIFLKNI